MVLHSINNQYSSNRRADNAARRPRMTHTSGEQYLKPTTWGTDQRRKSSSLSPRNPPRDDDRTGDSDLRYAIDHINPYRFFQWCRLH